MQQLPQHTTVSHARLEKNPQISVKMCCLAWVSTVLEVRLLLGDLLAGLQGSEEGNTSYLNLNVVTPRPERGEAANHESVPEGCREGQQQPSLLL